MHPSGLGVSMTSIPCLSQSTLPLGGSPGPLWTSAEPAPAKASALRALGSLHPMGRSWGSNCWGVKLAWGLKHSICFPPLQGALCLCSALHSTNLGIRHEHDRWDE